MKLSVFTVATPDLTPEQLAAAAAEAGLDGIEWRYKDVPEQAKGQKPSYWGNNICSIFPDGTNGGAERFRKAAESNGIASISVAPYLKVGDLEAAEAVLHTARAVGAQSIRLALHAYDRSRNVRELIAEELAYLQEMEPLCRQYGVKGLLETHHVTIAPSASAAYRLCERFDPDWIGVLYDPGNMLFEGFENYRMGMELLGPYLAHVHVKNGGWTPVSTAEDGTAEWKASWMPLRKGMVPWKQVVEDLAAVGYDGYLGLEDFSGELESVEMLKQYAAYMRSLLD